MRLGIVLRAAALIGLGRSAEILRHVLDTSLRAVARSASRLDSNELAVGDTATNVVGVLNLIELTAGARENRSCAKLVLESGGDLGVGVGLAGAWGDTGISQPLVSWEALEKSNSGVEEIDKLIFLGVVGVAAGVQSGVTGTMLAPFVLPERLVITLVVLPVGLHVSQNIAMTLVFKNAANISVCSRAITSGFVGAVAVVGPEAMDSP